MRIAIKFHSFIDVITNSSTELFCSIKTDKGESEIETIVKDILKEFGCNIFENGYYELSVWKSDGYDDDDQPNENKVYVSTERGVPLCKMVFKKLQEIFGPENIQEEYD